MRGGGSRVAWVRAALLPEHVRAGHQLLYCPGDVTVLGTGVAAAQPNGAGPFTEHERERLNGGCPRGLDYRLHAEHQLREHDDGTRSGIPLLRRGPH